MLAPDFVALADLLRPATALSAVIATPPATAFAAVSATPSATAFSAVGATPSATAFAAVGATPPPLSSAPPASIAASDLHATARTEAEARGARRAVAAESAAAAEPVAQSSGSEHGAEAKRGAADVRAAARAARLFAARLADAFDEAAARLVRELAADVLVRELRLAPCDLAALVVRVRERAPVVRVRVAPADAGLACGLPVVVDSALDGGDAVFELAGGALDARLGVRLADVLERLGESSARPGAGRPAFEPTGEAGR